MNTQTEPPVYMRSWHYIIIVSANDNADALFSADAQPTAQKKGRPNGQSLCTDVFTCNGRRDLGSTEYINL